MHKTYRQWRRLKSVEHDVKRIVTYSVCNLVGQHTYQSNAKNRGGDSCIRRIDRKP